MKPDGVGTIQTEPMEAEGTEPITEPIGNDGASQNGTTTTSPPQPDEPQIEQAALPTAKEAPGKAADAKSKSKGPVKGKIAAAGSASTGPGTQPKATQSRVANGLTKTAASTPTKKPTPATAMAADKKKPTTSAGPSGPSKKPVGSSAAVATSKAQPKVNNVGTTRSATTTKTGAAVGTASSLSRRPNTAATCAATKPKTTALAARLAAATAPAAKPSTSATAKTTAAPKTTRAPGSSAPRSATTSATGRTVTGTTTTTSAVTKTSRTATQQPSKPLVTASAVRKDVGKMKKTVTSTISRPAASKPLNSEAPKPAAATKRPPSSIKAPQPKSDDKKSVPTRKVPPSPRNNPSRPASGKNIPASSSHRQAGTISVKLQPSKPTQSVLPLVKGKKPDDKEPAAKPDNKEPTAESVQLSAAAVAAVAVATAAAIASEEFASGPETASEAEISLDPPISTVEVQGNVEVQEPNVNSQSVQDASNEEPETQEALIQDAPVQESVPTSTTVNQEFEEQVSGKADDKLIAAVAPVAQEATEKETLTASLFDNSASIIDSSGIEVAEKAEPINSECYEDVEEEEREGSQQVSLSEMSGTQPTEESRPGSVWRAGALLSELDSEDVSCSQQGASELSAPGVLEGTESMDDLGDASLKGADGEGASVGSPDFEKVPDILNNEDEDDDDDDDRVCDMEVGSERAEDSHRQLHDNEDDEEDEDVEMASEGITESGLESYGNADEDDLTDDYRLDNLNRIQPPPMVPSAPMATQWNQPSFFSDSWVQPPQPTSALLTSPSSECWKADPETPTQTSAQARIDVGSERGTSSPLAPNLFEPLPCSPRQAPLPAVDRDVSPTPGLTPSQTCKFLPGMSSDPDLASDRNRDASITEEMKDYSNVSRTETYSKGEPLNPASTVLPDIMQDLGIHLERADEEDEPETLPADDVLGGPATAPSSPSSATEDEASDTEGEMQISDPQAELPGSGNAYGTPPVGHNLSTLEEREEMGGENESGGVGGSDTPQSATSAASYGFDYMTSNSNAQSSAESCSKSPGIFSLENEEQLPDEAKDPSLLKELTLIPTTASEEKTNPIKSQHGELQSHPEHQYMLCGESSEPPEPHSVPGAVHLKSGMTDPSAPQHLEEEQDLDSQHPYYSTICEKTDSPLAERNSHFPPQSNDLLSIQMTMSSKLRLRPRASHVAQPPRLPTDLPPRIPNLVSNTQIRCLEQHQQHLNELQQRQEKRHREQERQEAREEKVRKEREDEEEQRRNLLESQLKQQEQELKQRQQIMQWQQELQQQQQQQQQKHKVHTPVVLSPLSGLSTIYETVETSDSEDDEKKGQRVLKELDDKSSFYMCHAENVQKYTDNSQHTTPSPESESISQDPQRELQETDTTVDQESPSPLGSPERPPPLEFDWGKKVDIVQQLINQTLLLAGDGVSPLLLLPGGAGGTLSPLESSLWPNLLPPLTPPSATVTSVSSFSPEAPGSSGQGEWTVVELETHH